MRYFLVFFLISPSIVLSQDLVVNYFGNPENEPILFLHGGPNGSSQIFEVLIADSLVNKGFYVITYDRRGEGRSKDSTAKITYEEMHRDINSILDSSGIEKVTLLSSSLGGYVGTKYASKHPERVKKFIMSDLGLSQKIAIDSLLVELKKKYVAENDSTMAGHTEYLLESNKDCNSWVHFTAFSMAVEADLKRNCEYTITPKRDSIRREILSTTDRSFNSRAHKLWGFNNNYACEDLRDEIDYIVQQGIVMGAILGDNELLISDYEIKEMKRLIGEDRVILIENGCHGVLLFRAKESLQHLYDLLSK